MRVSPLHMLLAMLVALLCSAAATGRNDAGPSRRLTSAQVAKRDKLLDQEKRRLAALHNVRSNQANALPGAESGRRRLADYADVGDLITPRGGFDNQGPDFLPVPTPVPEAVVFATGENMETVEFRYLNETRDEEAARVGILDNQGLAGIMWTFMELYRTFDGVIQELFDVLTETANNARNRGVEIPIHVTWVRQAARLVAEHTTRGADIRDADIVALGSLRLTPGDTVFLRAQVQIQVNDINFGLPDFDRELDELEDPDPPAAVFRPEADAFANATFTEIITNDEADLDFGFMVFRFAMLNMICSRTLDNV